MACANVSLVTRRVCADFAGGAWWFAAIRKLDVDGVVGRTGHAVEWARETTGAVRRPAPSTQVACRVVSEDLSTKRRCFSPAFRPQRFVPLQARRSAAERLPSGNLAYVRLRLPGSRLGGHHRRQVAARRYFARGHESVTTVSAGLSLRRSGTRCCRPLTGRPRHAPDRWHRRRRSAGRRPCGWCPPCRCR